MSSEGSSVTAGWGRHGQGDAVMLDQRRTVGRAFSPHECVGMGDTGPGRGGKTFDIFLNGGAFWHNGPAALWTYRLGGYHVLKNWLSSRERTALGRPLRPFEAQHFTDTERRVGRN